MQQQSSDFIKLHDVNFHFDTYFNPGNGQYLRTGIIDSAGHDTDVDPFMSSFPHLLDVGIMGHCNHGLSGKCQASGNRCYQNGLNIWQENMSLDNFKDIVLQSKGQVFQFALGGRGDPDQHESIEAILSFSRENGIIPNMTTSGYELTPAKAKMMATYCGATAVSWYKTPYTWKAIDLLLEYGSKVNIHFVLSNESIDEAIYMIEHETLPEQINRIIFLLFKPVGQGEGDDVLRLSDKTRYFFSLMDTDYGLKKMGFDSCCVPAVVNCARVVDPKCYDGCEAGRFSAYITPDMNFLPCSFDQSLQWAVSLQDHSIQEAWLSPQLQDFRQTIKAACPSCPEHDLCMGGCIIKPSITLCDRASKMRGAF